MPNFAGQRYGLISRIGSTPCPHLDPVYGARHGPLYIDALPVHYDHNKWLQGFLANWPSGSAAHTSYFERLNHGPAYGVKQAIRF